MLGRVTSKLTIAATRRANSGVVMCSRNMGGHGPKKAATPYDLPAGPGYSDVAYPFGLGPGYKTEGFEVITLVTYLACFGYVAFGLAAKENDSFNDWCRREALAREKHIANGGAVEFGKYYQSSSYEEDALDNMPVPAQR